MSSAEVAPKPAAKAAEKEPDAKAAGKREKRTITEIRESIFDQPRTTRVPPDGTYPKPDS